MRTNNFDPLAYIESAFLDAEHDDSAMTPPKVVVENLVDKERVSAPESLSMSIPSISDYLKVPSRLGDLEGSERDPADGVGEGTRKRFRKTVMSAPRPRRAKSNSAQEAPAIDPELQRVWSALPKNVEFLCSFYDDSVTKNYYRSEFKESRQELIQRLLDPVLSLEETSRLLGVCPATVRRYTNRGWLAHHRTEGGQRRFRLSDIVNFVDHHGRFPQE